VTGRATYLEIDRRAAFVEQYGTGENPVLCVHTAGQSGVQYRDAISGLVASEYSPVIVDLPGHGRSEPAHGGPVKDLGVYAAWCLKVVDELGLGRPYLLGCSIGGKVVLDIATRASSELAGVVAMACYAGIGGRKQLAQHWALEDSSSPSIRDRSLFGHAALCGSSVPAARRDMIALMHCREDWNVTLCDQAAWSEHDITEKLGAIACPVVLAVGEDDFSVPVHRVEESVSAIPTARGILIRGIGHYPMEEIEDFGYVFDTWVSDPESGDPAFGGGLLRQWPPVKDEDPR
jgi:pimeloyl-ACP methyl ester carboxylesterase